MSSAPNLVLRTVYLSPELDNKLRASAYDKKRTKNDLIRQYLEDAIKAEEREIGGSIYTHKSPKFIDWPLAVSAAVKKAAKKKAKPASRKLRTNSNMIHVFGKAAAAKKGNGSLRLHAKKAAAKKVTAKKVTAKKAASKRAASKKATSKRA